MEITEAGDAITAGKTYLGIEFGSTRIKAVLIDDEFTPLASSSIAWENQLKDGIWTYDLESIWSGIQSCYQDLADDVRGRYGVELTTVSAMGISAMMHGYMAFNEADQLLVPFRTWRNTITAEAAEALTERYRFNIPQRWSIAHLYQAILNDEPHVSKVAYLTTLAGYVHWRLTGKKVLGIGDASGVFPVSSVTKTYDRAMVQEFDAMVKEQKFRWKLENILPRVLSAGEQGGTLTADGAKLLDPTGKLQAGIPFCPPEGDAGTGMVATNSVLPRTGNISAGTSVFAMIVLEKPLSRVYPQIDLVATPSGADVAMVHCNNCTSDIDAWVKLFHEFTVLTGNEIDMDTLFHTLYRIALSGSPDCGGLLAYNYLSGEHITGVENGCPMFLRTAQSSFTLPNFMRANLYAALSTLKVGLNLLLRQEQVRLDHICGHGGLFKSSSAGRQILADAVGVPVSFLPTASEGGAWGMAILAAYLDHADGESLEQFLSGQVFADAAGEERTPDPDGMAGFEAYLHRYCDCLPVEKSAEKLLTRPKIPL